MRDFLESKPEITEEVESIASSALLRSADNAITEQIIGAAIEVHHHLGPGLLESAYEQCLCYELSQLGLPFRRQVHLPIAYKGLKLDCTYKMDIVVADRILIELKAVDQLLPIHTAQVVTYLKRSGLEIALLINFNETVLKKGLRRIVNRYAGPRVKDIPNPPLPAEAAAKPTNSAPSAPEARERATAGNLNPPRRESPRLRDSAVNPSFRRPR
jgi:GxxExxY protein